MNKRKIKLLVKNLESILETLKYELECDEQQDLSEETHPINNQFIVPLTDYDEVFTDEN